MLTIDACRVAGVNENLAILLLAAKFGVPVCPHAGGVGLCEMVQHLAMFDFVGVSAHDGRPGPRVRRPPARALHRPGARHRRPVPGAVGARLLRHAPAASRCATTSSPTVPSGSSWPATDHRTVQPHASASKIRITLRRAMRLKKTPRWHRAAGRRGPARRGVQLAAARSADQHGLAAASRPASRRARRVRPGHDRRRPDLQQHRLLGRLHQLRAAVRPADAHQAARPAARGRERQPAEPADRAAGQRGRQGHRGEPGDGHQPRPGDQLRDRAPRPARLRRHDRRRRQGLHGRPGLEHPVRAGRLRLHLLAR